MKKVLLLIVVLSAFVSTAQEKKTQVTDSIPPELAKKIFIYNASKQYNDPVVTRMAIYSLLAENPNNVQLWDSLALVYFEQQQYASAALVAQEVATAVPTDMFATEIAAICFERLGVKNKALGFYEKLYLDNTEDINTLYKMAFLQNDLKLSEEAINSTDQLLNHPKAKEIKLVFPTEDGKGQEVSMDLAALRLKGMIEASRDNKVKAKEYYNQVLKANPNFEVVKKQLDDLGS
jgi:tetratricopeptide (TPR) repeat protein